MEIGPQLSLIRQTGEAGEPNLQPLVYKVSGLSTTPQQLLIIECKFSISYFKLSKLLIQCCDWDLLIYMTIGQDLNGPVHRI